MAVSSPDNNGFTKTGLLLVSFLVLALVFIGAENTSRTARTTDTQGQYAQVGGIRLPDVTKIEPNTPPPIDSNSDTTSEQQSVLKKPSSCFTSALQKEIPANHYMRRQLIQNINGADEVCGVNNDLSITISTGATCNVYPGKNGEGATPTCPTAAVYKNNDGDIKTICWDESETPCEASEKSLSEKPKSEEKEEGARVLKVIDGKVVACRDGLCAKLPSTALVDYGNNELCVSGKCVSIINEIDPSAITSDAGIQLTSGGTDWGPAFADPDATKVVYSAGKISEAAPELGSKVTAIRKEAAPIRNAQITGASNQSGAIVQNTPYTQPVGADNPVTGAPSTGAVQRSGAGVDATSGNYQPTGQSRFQSLQRPDIFQPAQNAAPSALTGDRQSPRQPNFVERFARYFGAEQGLFNRQTPKGNTTNQTAQQPTPVVIVGNPADAHIRNIQAIAYDVAKQQTQPTDTRIESFEKTLTVVGGVHTSGRATTTINREYGRILDLITEDRAIKALEVAEQTGLRVRNRVFCIKEEKSEDCLLRRKTAAKRVERQTFVTELEKSNGISQADLEHFLAVYDGWVSPKAPRPKAQPISLINAPNKIDAVDEAATTTPGFISRVATGISKGVQKMLSALTSWLTP